MPAAGPAGAAPARRAGSRPAAGLTSLLEPLGLLHGAAAAASVRAGMAVWLAGGPTAFALARREGETEHPPGHGDSARRWPR